MLKASPRVQSLAEFQGAIRQSPRVAQLAQLPALIGTGSSERGLTPRPAGVGHVKQSVAFPSGADSRHEPPIQRRLVVDGREISAPTDLRDLAAPIRPLVARLIALPGQPVKLTPPQLDEVYRYDSSGQAPSTHEARVAIAQLLSNGAWTATGPRDKQLLYFLFAKKAPQEHLSELGRFLQTNPNVGSNLEAAGVGWALGSKDRNVRDMGGGAVMGERIHIMDWVLAEPGFMRMVVHEAGHATFQRMLLKGEAWSPEANTGTAPPDAKALDADGKAFYDAWVVIRKKPEFFFITEMPGDSPAATRAGRGQYLAGQFTEFCAESFMHLALERAALESHVARLPETEPTIRSAWASALAVLRKYERLILGAGGAGEGASTLRTHRFNAALDGLRTGLSGPDLEVVKPDAASKSLATLRGAWKALNPDERAQRRAEAIAILDQYIMKMERRRPAQAHLGAALDFADL